MMMRFLVLLPLLLTQGLAATRVSCSTTKGDFLIEMTPERGPLGAKRFLELVEDGFFTDIPMFRVLPGFLVQYGIPGRMDLKSSWEKWTSTRIKDDPHLGENNRDLFKKGDMSFAGAGADSRTTQVFVTYRDGTGLGGALHEVPFGRVIEGMENVEQFYSGYGDTAPFGKNGPVQGRMWSEGLTYLKKDFDKLDYINECHVLKDTVLPETAVESKRSFLLSQESHDGSSDGEQHEARANDIKTEETDATTSAPLQTVQQKISPVFLVAVFIAATVVLLWLRRNGFAYRKLRVL